jgi:hypothetical protein
MTLISSKGLSLETITEAIPMMFALVVSLVSYVCGRRMILIKFRNLKLNLAGS